MKKIDKLKQAVDADKGIQSIIRKKLRFYDIELFVNDALEYIQAIRNRSMFCVIDSVSKSGMSRTISFHSVKYYKGKYHFRNYYCLFTALGYTQSRYDKSLFTIYGAGMDMIFHTNYSNIYAFYNLGFLTNEERNVLCQMTPSVF